MGKRTILTMVLVTAMAAGQAKAAAVCGDVNESGTVSAGDALSVLRFAVGQPVELMCGPNGGVLITGQTLCYDLDGLEVDCATTGQDGEFQLGVEQNFTDNGDGTITDEVSGLMWEKLSDDGSIHDKDDTYTWTEAIDGKIALLNEESFAGHEDWRLPNRFELDTLVDLGASNPASRAPFNESCVPACTVLACSCTRPDHYWTSSTYLSAPAYAWTVYFAGGEAFSNQKTTSRFVRAVRGGF